MPVRYTPLPMWALSPLTPRKATMTPPTTSMLQVSPFAKPPAGISRARRAGLPSSARRASLHQSRIACPSPVGRKPWELLTDPGIHEDRTRKPVVKHAHRRHQRRGRPRHVAEHEGRQANTHELPTRAAPSLPTATGSSVHRAAPRPATHPSCDRVPRMPSRVNQSRRAVPTRALPPARTTTPIPAPEAVRAD